MLLCQTLVGQVSPREQKPDTRPVAEWKARIPDIQKIMKESKEGTCYGAPIPTIVDAFGLSTDRLSVALVDYCSAGAYVDSLIPMLLDHGRPVQATMRGADRKNLQYEFVSGASAMHSRFVNLVAEENAIYDGFTDNDNQGQMSLCGIKAYVWNSQSRTFDLNMPLSKSATAEYCRRLRAQR